MVGSELRVISLPINGVVKHIGASHLHHTALSPPPDLQVILYLHTWKPLLWLHSESPQLETTCDFREIIRLKRSYQQRESSGLSLNIVKLAVSNFLVLLIIERKESYI